MSHWLYLCLLLPWVLVLSLQWLIGWKKLWAERKRWPWIVVGGSIYFSLADSLALQQHIWFFSPTFLTGWSIGNVPIEEVLFFLCITAMIAQGFVLIAPPRQTESPS
jgi:lycopene cyclase domain-containing protein